MAAAEVHVVARGDGDDLCGALHNRPLLPAGESVADGVLETPAGRCHFRMVPVIVARPFIVKIHDVGHGVAAPPVRPERQHAKLAGGKEDQVEAPLRQQFIAARAKLPVGAAGEASPAPAMRGARRQREHPVNGRAGGQAEGEAGIQRRLDELRTDGEHLGLPAEGGQVREDETGALAVGGVAGREVGRDDQDPARRRRGRGRAARNGRRLGEGSRQASRLGESAPVKGS